MFDRKMVIDITKNQQEEMIKRLSRLTGYDLERTSNLFTRFIEFSNDSSLWDYEQRREAHRKVWGFELEKPQPWHPVNAYTTLCTLLTELSPTIKTKPVPLKFLEQIMEDKDYNTYDIIFCIKYTGQAPRKTDIEGQMRKMREEGTEMIRNLQNKPIEENL